MSNLWILTAVHNSLDKVKEFFSDLNLQTHGSFKVVVVDDGSNDGTSEWIQANHPQTIIIKGDGNLWWGGAMYLATKYAVQHGKPDDYILYINDDCRFDKDYLEKIMRHAKTTAILGSFCVSQRDKRLIIDGPSIFDWNKGKLIPLFKNKSTDSICTSSIYKSDTLTTRGTLYPLSALIKTKNFDYKVFAHHTADLDLSLRAKALGYDLLFYPDIYILLDEQRTGITLHKDLLTKPQNFSYIYKLFFSKKSAYNLPTRLAFINRHVPPKYKLNFLKSIIYEFLLYTSNIGILFYTKKIVRPSYLWFIKYFKKMQH